MQIAEQARNEKGKKKLFETCTQGKDEVYIASLARWDTQLTGLAELERRCQDLMHEMELLSEKSQEVLNGMVEDKIRLHSESDREVL